MPAKLSYNKFAALLHKNGYITSVVYFVRREGKKAAVFFECRLPKTQKNILVHVPSRYLMILPSEITPRTIELVESEGSSALTEKSVAYLLDVRGPLIEADLAAISSDGLCHSKFSGATTCYFLASNLPEVKEHFEDLVEEDDEVHQLEKELSVAKQKLKSQGVDVPETPRVQESEKESDKPEQSEPEPVNLEPSDPDGTGPVELTFEDGDEDGEESPSDDVDDVNSEDEEPPIGDKADGVDSDESSDDELTDEDDIISLSSEDEQVEPPKATPSKAARSKAAPLKVAHSRAPASTGEISHRSNHIDMEELDISLGIIYVVIDINMWHKSFDTYENDALSVYEQIDDNERDMRNSRLGEIKKQLELVANHLELRIQQIESDEKGIRYHLLRLTAVLQDAENIRSGVRRNVQTKSSSNLVTNPEILEVERVYNRTRKTVHEMNIALLRQREEVEDVLTNYEESLKELFEL